MSAYSTDKDIESKKEELLAICQKTRENGLKIDKNQLGRRLKLKGSTVHAFIQKHGYQDIVKTKKEAAKKRQISLEEAQKRTPEGTVIGRDDSGYFIIRAEDGFEYRKKISHLNQGDPRKNPHEITEEMAIKRVESLGMTYIGGFVDKDTSMRTRCKEGHIRQVSLPSLERSGCPECDKYGTSQKEKIIGKFVESLGFYQEKLTLPSTKGACNGKSIDVFIREKMLGIEFCGVFWHHERGAGSRNKHLIKLEESEAQGIELLTIFENEFEYKKQALFSLIASKLNIFSSTIRITTVQTISNCVAKDFIEQNSIEDVKDFSLAIGGYVNNQLVSVLTYEIEENVIVVKGLFDKLKTKITNKDVLFDFFASNEEVRVIFDRRFGQPKELILLGFVVIKTLNPDFKYYKAGKKDLYKKEDVEILEEIKTLDKDSYGLYNLDNSKYKRVWNCGYLVLTKGK